MAANDVTYRSEHVSLNDVCKLYVRTVQKHNAHPSVPSGRGVAVR
jgi:hypothetical protein